LSLTTPTPGGHWAPVCGQRCFALGQQMATGLQGRLTVTLSLVLLVDVLSSTLEPGRGVARQWAHTPCCDTQCLWRHYGDTSGTLMIPYQVPGFLSTHGCSQYGHQPLPSVQCTVNPTGSHWEIRAWSASGWLCGAEGWGWGSSCC
jgi:hypothetical protein